MTIKTTYEVGDVIVVDGGGEYKIKSSHVYESSNKHTERYYLGNGLWLTLVRERK